MRNVNLKYPFFNEYDNEKKLNVLGEEARLETNNGTKKEDLTNLVKFAAKEIFNLETRLEFSNAALSEIRDWCAEYEATGDPKEAFKTVRRIYEIAHDRLEEEAE